LKRNGKNDCWKRIKTKSYWNCCGKRKNWNGKTIDCTKRRSGKTIVRIGNWKGCFLKRSSQTRCCSVRSLKRGQENSEPNGWMFGKRCVRQRSGRRNWQRNPRRA